jgi:curved DNA-binding protein
MKTKDYYSILFVPRDASEEEIKKSYRRLALRYHPDKNDGDQKQEDRFKEINEAYSVLGDQRKRRQYDALGHGEFNRLGDQKSPFNRPFSYSPWGFQGPFHCQGRGIGMARAFGRRCGGRGWFPRSASYAYPSFSSPGNPKTTVHLIHLSNEEAQLGAEKEIVLEAGGVKHRVTAKIPPGIRDKAMLFMKGEDLGQRGQDIYFQIRIIK